MFFGEFMHRNKIFGIFFVFIVIGLFSANGVYAFQDPAEDLAFKFLERVARINAEKNYSMISFNTSTGKIPNSQHFQTTIRVVFSDGQNKFETLTTLIKERFWMYFLYPLSWEDSENELTLEDCLIIANQAVEEYRVNFDAEHCGIFAQMLSTAIQTQSLIVEDNNYLLKINCTESCSTQWEKFHYAQIQLFEKINGQFVTPFRAVYISVSKNGLVTEFVDNLGVYNVVTTNINVSQQEAINIATPYIKAYAQKHQQEITTINAKCEFIKDISGCRGESFAIYPQWHIMAMFDKTNEEGIFGYSVMIWADNGKVYHHEPQGCYLSEKKATFSFSWEPILVAAIALAIGLCIYLGKIPRRGRSPTPLCF